jgi:hypothetical protein
MSLSITDGVYDGNKGDFLKSERHEISRKENLIRDGIVLLAWSEFFS